MAQRGVELRQRGIHAGFVRGDAFKEQGRNVDWEGAKQLCCLLETRKEDEPERSVRVCVYEPRTGTINLKDALIEKTLAAVDGRVKELDRRLVHIEEGIQEMLVVQKAFRNVPAPGRIV